MACRASPQCGHLVPWGDREVNPVPSVLQTPEQGWAHPKDHPVAGQGCHT